MHSLTQNTKTMRIEPDDSTYIVAAGQGTSTSEVVDTAGWTGVRFILGMGVIASSGTVNFHIHGGDTTSPTTNITGAAATAYTDTDDNKISIIEVINSPYRYMKAVTVTAAGDGTIDFLLVELFNPCGSVPDQTAGATKKVMSEVIVENV